MKLVLMAIGGLFIAFGLVDLIGSFADFDLWGGFLGVQLPEILWKYSAYLEIIIGYVIFNAGRNSSDSSGDEATEQTEA